MMYRRGAFNIAALAACTVFGVASCSAGGDAAPDSDIAAVEGVPADAPKVPPIKLPDFWDGMDGGIFKFPGETTAFTSNGILAIHNASLGSGYAGTASIWTWDGEHTLLEPTFDDGEGTVTHNNLVHRDGRWYMTSLWSHQQKVDENSLGDGKYTEGLTTWDDTGAVVFHGERGDTADIDLYWMPANIEGRKSRYFVWDPSDDGYLVNHPEAMKIDGRFVGNAEVRIDPISGEVSVGRVPTEEAPSLLSEAVTATGNWGLRDGSVTFTNTKTGTTTVVTTSEVRCGRDTGTPSVELVASSFDGRYIAAGGFMIDTETGDSSCLASDGDPRLSAVTSTGIGYGGAQQNGNTVRISYDFATKDITILRDAMVLPDLVGPNDVAIEQDKDSGSYAVYRTAEN